MKIGSKQRTAEIEAQGIIEASHLGSIASLYLGSFQICQDILDEKERQNDKLGKHFPS